MSRADTVIEVHDELDAFIGPLIRRHGLPFVVEALCMTVGRFIGMQPDVQKAMAHAAGMIQRAVVAYLEAKDGVRSAFGGPGKGDS